LLFFTGVAALVALARTSIVPEIRALGLERGAGVLLYAGAERREKVAAIRC
jgi:hypothetical protein